MASQLLHFPPPARPAVYLPPPFSLFAISIVQADNFSSYYERAFELRRRELDHFVERRLLGPNADLGFLLPDGAAAGAGRASSEEPPSEAPSEKRGSKRLYILGQSEGGMVAAR